MGPGRFQAPREPQSGSEGPQDELRLWEKKATSTRQHTASGMTASYCGTGDSGRHTLRHSPPGQPLLSSCTNGLDVGLRSALRLPWLQSDNEQRAFSRSPQTTAAGTGMTSHGTRQVASGTPLGVPDRPSSLLPVLAAASPAGHHALPVLGPCLSHPAPQHPDVFSRESSLSFSPPHYELI